MQTMREKWTDERLDDLKDQMVDGFRRTDERFVHLERTMNQWFMVLVGMMLTGFSGLAALMIALA